MDFAPVKFESAFSGEILFEILFDSEIKCIYHELVNGLDYANRRVKTVQ